MRILATLQEGFKTSVEVDFFGKDLLAKMVEDLTHSALQHPGNYNQISTILHALMVVQPIDTFTQNTLTSILAVASMPGMGTEVKPLDLRLRSETLWHNLSKAKVEMTDASLKILTRMVKDIAPKWRLTILRKVSNQLIAIRL